jgi:hypothetical protein
MAGFTYRLSHHGGNAMVQEWISADAALAIGDFVNQESGQADLAVTSDSSLIGAVIGAADPTKDVGTLTAGTDKILVVSNIDAVYGVADANARNASATLDIAGGTGAQTVATSSNAEFIVHATKSNAADETLVRINTADSWMD